MKRRTAGRLLAAGAGALALAMAMMGGALTAYGGIGDLAGAADPRLAYITASEYGAFESWMQNNEIGLADAKGSAYAWTSYALDASGLIDPPQTGDVSIVSLETAADGAFTFEVAVSNVWIGQQATPEKLASVFEVEGSPSLAADLFSSANVTADLGVSNGRLLVVATPAAAHETFFVRVRMHAEYDDWFKDIYGPPPDEPPSDPHGDGVQLWAGGPCWAETNIGADEPWDYGYYFWWGDTIGYKRENDKWVASDGSSTDYSFSTANTPTYDKDLATLRSEGWITADGVLAPSNDAAQVQWGGGWRMPTYQELADLTNSSKCVWTWTTTNGVSGYVVRGTGDYDANSIFLPCAGYGNGTLFSSAGSLSYYWSSVPSSGSYYACGLSFKLDRHGTSYNSGRGIGFSVRPVKKPRGKVQLWEGGPYWAETNIGAEKPEDSGSYFWWGDTVGYKWENDAWVASDGSSINFSFINKNTPTADKTVGQLQGGGWITADGVLAPEHDAARVQWGGEWRMPTYQELSDLANSSKCVWTWTTTNGVNGYVVRGRDAFAANSIFLPCAGSGLETSRYNSGSYGYYWSSAPHTRVSGLDYAWRLRFDSRPPIPEEYYRSGGLPVRPVQSFAE